MTPLTSLHRHLTNAISQVRARAADRRPFRVTRTAATKALSGIAILFVGAVVVATSIPAQALLTPQDVQARLSSIHPATSSQAAGHAPAQALQVSASSATITAPRDAATATTEVQLAAIQAQQLAQEQAAAAAAAAAAAVAAEEKQGANVPAGSVIWPFAGMITISSPFGARVAPTEGATTFHEGIDIEEPAGTPIHAIADGTVVQATTLDDNSCGVNVTLKHVINGQVVLSKYCHMELGSLTLAAGQAVHVGQVIGLVGQTGVATGPHLHLEIHPNGGDAVDPDAWLTANVH